MKGWNFLALVASRSRWLASLLLAVVAANSFAHDPYEITSRAYLYSNHLELRMEMEFPAAMLLARNGGAQPDAATRADQFALALPALQARAAEFLRITSRGGPLTVTNTNVSLGVEDHVRVVLKFPVTEAREFKFAVGELQTLSAHGPYGTSLTVVDMVRNEVLAQSVLFGDSPPLELLTTTSAPAALSNAPNVVRIAATNLAPAPATDKPSGSKPSRFIIVLLVLITTALFLRNKHRQEG